MSETDTNIAIGPRILHLIPADGIGGVEVAAQSMLAKSDLPCEFRLQFIEPSGPAGRTIASYAGVIKANAKALRNARAFKPDVILCSLWRSVPLALALRDPPPRQARLPHPSRFAAVNGIHPQAAVYDMRLNWVSHGHDLTLVAHLGNIFGNDASRRSGSSTRKVVSCMELPPAHHGKTVISHAGMRQERLSRCKVAAA